MKGLPRSRSRGSPARQDIIKQTFKMNALALTVNGATGVGFGTAVLGDFPEGNILVLGATGYVSLDGPASGVTATFNGDFSVGSVPNANTDLAGAGEANILPSTAIGPAVATVTPRARAVNSTAVMLDNTDGSLELNLNVLIDDADISADGAAFLATGEINVVYIMLGDD